MSSRFVVCAPGVSLTAEQVAQVVAAGLPIVAAGDAIRLTRDHAVALAGSDAAWWKQYPEWQKWPGRKFTLAPETHKPDGIERLETGQCGSNSALLAIQVARHLGATSVLLLGVDLHSPGDHFFGRHPDTLRSSTPQRFEVFKRQFAQYRPRDLDIVNCTPGTALHCYRKSDLASMLAQSQVRAVSAG